MASQESSNKIENKILSNSGDEIISDITTPNNLDTTTKLEIKNVQLSKNVTNSIAFCEVRNVRSQSMTNSKKYFKKDLVTNNKNAIKELVPLEHIKSSTNEGQNELSSTITTKEQDKMKELRKQIFCLKKEGQIKKESNKKLMNIIENKKSIHESVKLKIILLKFEKWMKNFVN